MKTLILWILVLTIASISNAQNVNIPDTAFLYALIDEGVDTNGDSLISYDEAKAVISLDVGVNTIYCRRFCPPNGYNRNISDLTGIEAFINLDSLNIERNKIDYLDLSENNDLRYLNCSDNQLTNLDISGCTALSYLNCRDNQLTSLDVSDYETLTDLDCSFNQLTSLDVSGCTALLNLTCRVNQLTNLDVSGCTALTNLRCWYNQLTNLDVSGCTTLTNLRCWHNQLTSLDVSNNTALKYLYLRDMPSLCEVCVWEGFDIGSIYIDTEDSPNVNFTTGCAVNIPNEYTVNSTMNIYPNPSDDIINIEVENINNATIEIYNVSGRLVFSKALDSKVEKIDISGLSEGIYLVKVRQENNVAIEKLIVY